MNNPARTLMQRRASVIATCVVLNAILALQAAQAQTPYRSYVSGDAADVQTRHRAGLVLAGGGRDNNNAMRWMLERADGGDVVVLRTNESDGYNDYFFRELGVRVNSVETLVIPSVAVANIPEIAAKLRAAEVVFIAGGDQTQYVNAWRGTPVQEALNFLINQKRITIGGTSAGMAILCGLYYFPRALGVISAEALSDPFHRNMREIGRQDFLTIPLLRNVLTDTHYDNRERAGRHVAMLARVEADWNVRAFGIACNERTAVCIDEQGIGRVFSESLGQPEAYFLQSNCEFPVRSQETCVAGQRLTWNRGGRALKAYKIQGDTTGSRTFNLNDWRTGSGGVWEDWFVEAGEIWQRAGSPPPCQQNLMTSVTASAAKSASASAEAATALHISPQPAQPHQSVTIALNLPQASAAQGVTVQIVNVLGQVVAEYAVSGSTNTATPHAITLATTLVWKPSASGVYVCRVQGNSAGKHNAVLWGRLVVVSE
jgi:cyanophycinase-like exopeptidase